MILQRLLYTRHFHSVYRRSKSTVTNSNGTYCMGIVQKSNYENYLELLLLPEFARAPAFAISALNVQIAQVFDVAKDPTIAKMRLQFWHDTIDLCYKNQPPKQPVAEELNHAIRYHNLSKFYFRKLIAGRQVLLQNQVFRSMNDLDNYAEDTITSFYCLLLEVLDAKNSEGESVATHIGIAKSIVNSLRSVPFHGNLGQVHLPLDLLLKYSVSEEDVIRGSRDRKMKDLVRDLSERASENLEKARSIIIPREVRSVFLCSVAVENYLKILKKLDYDVFDGKLRQRNHLLPLNLMMKKFWGGY